MRGSRLADLSKHNILRDLPAREGQRLIHNLQLISLAGGESLYRSGDPLESVYFPLSAVVSVFATMNDGRSVALHLVGNEGIVGIQALLGAVVSEHSVVVQ